VTSLVASVFASAVAWLVEVMLSGHVSDGTSMVVSFLVFGAVFIPSYVWIKRVRDGL
jgi:hypothetical protein